MLGQAAISINRRRSPDTSVTSSDESSREGKVQRALPNASARLGASCSGTLNHAHDTAGKMTRPRAQLCRGRQSCSRDVPFAKVRVTRSVAHSALKEARSRTRTDDPFLPWMPEGVTGVHWRSRRGHDRPANPPFRRRRACARVPGFGLPDVPFTYPRQQLPGAHGASPRRSRPAQREPPEQAHRLRPLLGPLGPPSLAENGYGMNSPSSMKSVLSAVVEAAPSVPPS